MMIIKSNHQDYHQTMMIIKSNHEDYHKNYDDHQEIMNIMIIL